jgi:exocyst complex component 4
VGQQADQMGYISSHHGDGGHGVSSGIGSAVAPQGGLLGASSLRLAALESSAKWVDHETLEGLLLDCLLQAGRSTQGLTSGV